MGQEISECRGLSLDIEAARSHRSQHSLYQYKSKAATARACHSSRTKQDEQYFWARSRVYMQSAIIQRVVCVFIIAVVAVLP
jgi:hypothetical protein